MSRRLVWTLGVATVGVVAALVLAGPLDGWRTRPAVPTAWSHALVARASDHHLATITSARPLAPGAVMDVNMGQLFSHAGRDVTLVGLALHDPPPHLVVVGEFLADLCGAHPDPVNLLWDTESARRGIRTYYPNSHPVHRLLVPTPQVALRWYARHRPHGVGCSFSPRSVWVLRITAERAGRYSWDGFTATYRVGGRTYHEWLPQDDYRVTWR